MLNNKFPTIADILSNFIVYASFGKHKFIKGGFYNIFGREMTGKSAIVLYLINQMINNKLNVLFFETEDKLNRYEAIQSEKYILNISKVILGDYKIFISKKIESYQKGKIIEIPDFSDFLEKLKKQIQNDNINVVVIDSISKPLEDYHWKIASAATTDFIFKLGEIVSKTNILCIIVSHAKDEYDRIEKKWGLMPKGSKQSRYLIKRMMTLKNTTKRTHNFYSLIYHNTDERFDINEDGTIDNNRIGD